MQRLDIHYCIVWESWWHAGSGFGTAATDRLVQRLGGLTGIPFIPGSHVKGVLRHTCERLAATLGLDCIAPHATTPEQQQKLVEHFRPLAASQLVVDRLFGSRFQGECLFVSHALPLGLRNANPDPEPRTIRFSPARTTTRSRTSIDRATRTVREGHLFSTEITDVQHCLEGEIRARHAPELLTQYEESVPYEYGLLVLALLSIDRLGGDKSLGMGRCRIQITDLEWQQRKITVEECVGPLSQLAAFSPQEVTEWLEGLRQEKQP
ncbi:MAG: hypothetical protein KatS3mg110_0255 [Pirellulaceae bacterium]|nr:MAG: hypothetical protein KatS3mg110_0255 [Pirellulaceae bacterium]